MDSDALLEKINDFISQINRVDSISEAGLKQTDFPDKVILSLHNHLGNAKHYISDETTAFNATEQFISITHAERELNELRDDLLLLKQHDVIAESDFELLSIAAYEVDELLRKITDPEYT